MTTTPANVLELPLIKRAEMAFKIAVEKVMEKRIRLGLPIFIWRDGKVVEIPADRIREELSKNP